MKLNAMKQSELRIQVVKDALKNVEDTLGVGSELQHRDAVLEFEAQIRILLGDLKGDFHDAIKPITEEDIKKRFEDLSMKKGGSL